MYLHQPLESLVTVRGKLNEWIRSKGIPAPYDPPQIITWDLAPLEIANKDITDAKGHPHRLIHSIFAKDLLPMDDREAKQKLEA